MKRAIFADESEVAEDLASASSWEGESEMPGLAGFSSPCLEILNEGGYRAFVQDVECMWRWEIRRDGKLVQDGCSLSQDSSREAVDHVMAFFRIRDTSAAGKIADPHAISSDRTPPELGCN
jgi:soluble methane monooxygenase-binding protein MmoD